MQSHRIEVHNDSRHPDFDGIAELWFDDMDALLAARRTPEWKASSEDEANFINQEKAAYFISHERVIL